MKNPYSLRFAVLALGLLLTGAADRGVAATVSWSSTLSSSSDGSWSEGGNWTDGVAPANGDSVVFYNSSARTVVDDIGGLVINTLTFDASAPTYWVTAATGVSLGISGGIVDNAQYQELITAPLVLSGSGSEIWTTGGGATLTVLGSVSNTNGLTIMGTGATEFSGVLGGIGSLTKSGSGSLTISGAGTATGSTYLTQGSLVFSGSGGLASSSVTVGSDGSSLSPQLSVSNPTAGTTTRTGGLIWNGGAGSSPNNPFNFIVASSPSYGAGGNTVERFGSLTLNSGVLSALVSSSSNSTPGYNTEIVFNQVTRRAGTFLDFSHSPVGVSTIASQTFGQANVVFNVAPTLSGNGGAAGSAGVSILPWANVGGVLATYDTTYGLRALDTTTEMATLASGPATGGAAGLNAKITSDTTLTSATTRNSLDAYGGSAVLTLGGNTLTLSNGALADSAFRLVIGSTPGDGTLALGTEGIFFVQRQLGSAALTVNSVISGSNGLTLVLDGGIGTVSPVYSTVDLAGANTYTGVTTLEGNTTGLEVRLLNSLAFQNTTLDYNNYGASLAFGGGLTAFTFGGLEGSQNLALVNDTGGSVTLTGGGNGANTTYSGSLRQNGALIKVGSGTLTLAGVATYTGGTTINGGTLALGINYALGTASTALTIGSGGTLDLRGYYTVVGALTGSGLIDSTSSYGWISATSINPGAVGGVGTLRIGDGTLGLTVLVLTNATMVLDMDTTGHDQIAVGASGTIAFNGTSIVINDLSGGNLAPGTYAVATASQASQFTGLTVDANGNITGGLSSSTQTVDGMAVTLQLNGAEIDVVLGVIPVPEPSSLMLSGLGATVLAIAGRRRHPSRIG